MFRKRLDRRTFVELMAVGSGALLTPGWLRSAVPALPGLRPVRIRGRVTGDGRGLAGARVSDGLSVVHTDADGAYEILSSTLRDFVQVSVPPGFQIPRNPTGTARFYERIAPGSSDEQSVTFDLRRSERDDDQHALLLLADIQTEDTDETTWFHEQSVPDVQATVRDLGAMEVFGVACGDIMYDHLDLYPEYERGVSRMGVPFFQVVGNHDMDYVARIDEVSTATFSRHFGPRYYSFDRGAVHYVILDDVFWNGVEYFGYLDRDQLTWLEADLATVERGRTVIVAAHIPILGSQHTREGGDRPSSGVSVTNRQELYRLLEPFQSHVLTGHTHESEHLFEHGVHEHVNGTVCGAWWSGPICSDGTPSGYSVYEIHGEAVRWRYKATGHEESYQMRVYPVGADAGAPDEIVANVWDWDPEWTVVWYEDGDRRGAMARRNGHDPLSVELHMGPDLPPRRTWVEPYTTGHLFYAPATPGARITVEATDRFGRTYSATPGAYPETAAVSENH